MKPSTSAYALAASFLPLVLASPFHQLRHALPDVKVVTDVETEVVTTFAQAYVTQYGDATSAAAASPSASSPPAYSGDRGSQHDWHHSHSSAPVSSAPATSSSPVVVSTSSTVAPPPVVSSTSSTTSSTPTPTPTTTAAPVSTTPATSSTSSSAAAAPSYGSFVGEGESSYNSQNLQPAILNSTNIWRKRFQAQPLTWNATLATMAQNTANSCNWTHTNAGQNYDGGFSGVNPAVDCWGGEYTKYNFATSTPTDDTGHFTQLVWQDTTTVGCAAYNCPSPAEYDGAATGWFLVCNYYPIGNWAGEWAEGVKAPIS